uniref:Uncharacterized protein n=1 Tax=Globodera pallida TaxID=36090 RepID=A0A183CPN4_GLOPA
MYRNKFLRTSSFIMFLNKKDIFAKKLLQVPLQQFLPRFEGRLIANPTLNSEELYTTAVDFIKQTFTTIRRQDKRQIYAHVTNATG